jgi:hypothetical protein
MRAMPLLPLAIAAMLVGVRSQSAGSTDWVKGFVRPLSAWAGRRALVSRTRSRQAPERGRFTPVDVDRLVSDAWRRYDEAAPICLPSRPSGVG